MAGQRTTYYIAWYFTDSATISSGLAFNGKEGFTRQISVIASVIEFGNNPRNMMVAWNH